MTNSAANTAVCASNRRRRTDRRDAPDRYLFRYLIALTFICGLAADPAAADDGCKPDSPDESVSIDHIIDGDTVILGSGDHLRLIGIDAPEIDHEGGNTEAGALAARDHLVRLLAATGPYPLALDREERDRYGRLLGHLFLPDVTNIQARLLARGYALPLTVPPNLRFLDCYRAAAETARRKHLGIWRQPRYRPLSANGLTADVRGYRIVEGTVTRIGTSRSSMWINLGRDFALRILRQDLSWFPDRDIDRLAGKTIRARGKVYRRNDQLRMRVRHQVDLQILQNETGNR